MGGKIVPEIPVKGICPLECFDAGDMLELGENGKYRLKPEAEEKLLEEGVCCIPALYMAEGSLPSENHFIDCAAIDTRKSYLNCKFFLKWFWHTAATKNKLIKVMRRENERHETKTT
jgi:hypothetical protein